MDVVNEYTVMTAARKKGLYMNRKEEVKQNGSTPKRISFTSST
jgi:hypothetical protein